MCMRMLYDGHEIDVSEKSIQDVLDAVMEGGWTSDDPAPTLEDAARIIRESYEFREEVWNDMAAKGEV